MVFLLPQSKKLMKTTLKLMDKMSDSPKNLDPLMPSGVMSVPISFVNLQEFSLLKKKSKVISKPELKKLLCQPPLKIILLPTLLELTINNTMPLKM
jgi:hypothetical protein